MEKIICQKNGLYIKTGFKFEKEYRGLKIYSFVNQGFTEYYFQYKETDVVIFITMTLSIVEKYLDNLLNKYTESDNLETYIENVIKEAFNKRMNDGIWHKGFADILDYTNDEEMKNKYQQIKAKIEQEQKEKEILKQNELIKKELEKQENLNKNAIALVVNPKHEVSKDIIIQLFQKYEIWVSMPIKLKGWINSKLVSANGSFSYTCYSKSTVFLKYFGILIDKIKEDKSLNIKIENKLDFLQQ